MTGCPNCGSEMDFIGRYGEWYCSTCNQYHVPLHETALPSVRLRMGGQEGEHPEYPEKFTMREKRGVYYPEDHAPRLSPINRSRMIIGGTIFVIILMLLALYSLVYITTHDDGGLDGGNGDDGGGNGDNSRNMGSGTYFNPRFPTIEPSIYDAHDEGDRIVFKHIQGDPLVWSDHKIIITNNSDNSDTLILSSLSSFGQITAGETTMISIYDTNMDKIDFNKGCSYTLEIYDLKNNKREYAKENLVCE